MQVVTLAERQRRRMARMEAAIAEIDRLLTDYARRYGGRFIRYGSTAKGTMRAHSDVDIIADFEEAKAGPASNYAEEVCARHDMPADVRPVYYVSPRLMTRALDEGIVLS